MHGKRIGESCKLLCILFTVEVKAIVHGEQGKLIVRVRKEDANIRQEDANEITESF